MNIKIKIGLIDSANNREALTNILGEELLVDLELKFGGIEYCYVRIQNSMNYCVIDHFRKFIQGYIYGSEK